MKKILVIFLLAALSIFFLDRPVALFFHNHYVSFFKPITALGNAALWLIPTLLLWLFLRKTRPYQAKNALFVFGSVVISGLIVDILKPIIGRARPKVLFHEDFFGIDPLTFKASFWSMPSGHSATAFAVGVSLALLFPRYRIPILIASTLVAFSRIALTKHYLSDVIVGSAIGALTALWLYKRMFHAK